MITSAIRIFSVLAIGCWSYGLMVYHQNDALHNYAILELALNCILLAVNGWNIRLLDSISIVFISLSPLIYLGLLFMGYQAFVQITLRDPVTLLFSSDWLNMNFLIQCVLFDLWAIALVFVLGLTLLVLAFYDVPSGTRKFTVNLWNSILGLSQTQELPMVPVEFTSVNMEKYFDSAPQYRNDQESCSICLCDFDETSVKAKTCSHYFHRECMRDWLSRLSKSARTCPLCKQHLVAEVVIPVE